MAVTMILAGMNSSLKRLSPDRSPNTDLNLELAAAVLSCFSPDDFDSFGLLAVGLVRATPKLAQRISDSDDRRLVANVPNRFAATRRESLAEVIAATARSRHCPGIISAADTPAQASAGPPGVASAMLCQNTKRRMRPSSPCWPVAAEATTML